MDTTSAKTGPAPDDRARALRELHAWPARAWLFREGSRVKRFPGIEVVPDYLQGPPDWREVFGMEGALEIEIGCGKGNYLVRAARERPGHRLLGIERARKYVEASAERVRKAGLPNARVVWAEAVPFLTGAVAEGSARAIHIYFPDPWPKKRHHKRRLFTPAAAAALHAALEPGGRIHVATDHEEYFPIILEALSGCAGLRRGELDEVPEEPLTSFERKYRAEGRTILRAVFERGG